MRTRRRDLLSRGWGGRLVTGSAAVVLISALLALSLPGGPNPSSGPAITERSLVVASGTDAGVTFLPSQGTASHCVTQAPGQPDHELPLKNGTLQTNVYAAPAGTTGHAGLCYDSSTGSLLSYVNWSKVGGNGGWFSYPEDTYGVDRFNSTGDTYTNQSSVWKLPQSVATTISDRLWVTAAYDYHPPVRSKATGDDLSFDNYLTKELPPTWENGTPFIEVLVLLAHKVWSYPSEWIAWSMRTLVNSHVETVPWDIGYWCHGPDNGTSATVTFDFSYGGSPRTTIGLQRATVGVNMSAVLREVETLAPNVGCWTGTSDPVSSFYLDQEVFGAEAGVHTSGAFKFNWTVTQYCLHVNVRSVSSATVSCTAGLGASPRTTAPPGVVPVGRSVAGILVAVSRPAGISPVPG
jgi:hypothetical protein